MATWTELALECARVAREGLRLPAGESPLAVVLGSGLGGLAEALEERRALPFASLPGLPPATVQGHEGRLVYGTLAQVPVLALQGRLHGYEGHDAATVAFPARVLGVLGARALVVTNAAGGCNASFAPGDLMRITDHLNLTGRNPLLGPNEERLGPRFPDLTHAYDPRLAAALEEAARGAGQSLRAGVYAQLNGPSYETPAEVRMARALGADAVGMSTVPEVIVAAHMGLPLAGISCITNLAAGISQHPLTHEEVMEVARAVEGKFLELLGAFIPLAYAAVPPRQALG
ncbi:MAG TPA: purine-nucleoside phosphorylase [Myxococcales bacterium]|nr:purine-nucleoside phosphorylase [Myxococcales bacterium]